MKVQNVPETIPVYKVRLLGTYFVETCQVGVLKMCSILNPARNHIWYGLRLRANVIIS